jgi:hypothetical protein
MMLEADCLSSMVERPGLLKLPVSVSPSATIPPAIRYSTA